MTEITEHSDFIPGQTYKVKDVDDTFFCVGHNSSGVAVCEDKYGNYCTVSCPPFWELYIKPVTCYVVVYEDGSMNYYPDEIDANKVRNKFGGRVVKLIEEKDN